MNTPSFEELLQRMMEERQRRGYDPPTSSSPSSQTSGSGRGANVRESSSPEAMPTSPNRSNSRSHHRTQPGMTREQRAAERAERQRTEDQNDRLRRSALTVEANDLKGRRGSYANGVAATVLGGIPLTVFLLWVLSHRIPENFYSFNGPQTFMIVLLLGVMAVVILAGSLLLQTNSYRSRPEDLATLVAALDDDRRPVFTATLATLERVGPAHA